MTTDVAMYLYMYTHPRLQSKTAGLSSAVDDNLLHLVPGLPENGKSNYIMKVILKISLKVTVAIQGLRRNKEYLIVWSVRRWRKCL